MLKTMAASLTAICCLCLVSVAAAEDKQTPAALNFEMKSLDGKPVNLKKYQGKVLLVVNVASECGLTPQYADLQKLHDQYAQEGLAVLGFPCNQFGAQEPGTEKEIAAFCQQNYGVKFDMFSKVDVNGEGACDLYKYLTKLDTKPKGPGKVSWNFEKFLIDRDGQVVARFSPRTSPTSDEIVEAVKRELAE